MKLLSLFYALVLIFFNLPYASQSLPKEVTTKELVKSRVKSIMNPSNSLNPPLVLMPVRQRKATSSSSATQPEAVATMVVVTRISRRGRVIKDKARD